MQEISLEQLKKLLPNELHENDHEVAEGMSFKYLCKKYAETLKWSSSIRQAYSIFVDEVLSKCKSIKFVGDGSSRVTFACIGGKCIKIAKYQSGVAQNKQEEKHTAKHWWKKNFDCFVQTYGHSDDYGLLLSECCAHIDSERDLAKALGMDSESTLTAAVWAVAREKNHDVKKSATSLRAKCAEWKKSGGSINGTALDAASINTAEQAMKWLESLSDKRSLTPGKKSFLQITNFWKKYGINELLPGDVCSCCNWGYAIRDGELTPVMLDVGFSQKVADVFYEDNHMNNESKLISYWAHMLDESQLVDEVKHSMHGPAYARQTGGIDEIADMREKLANGVVEFTFWKHGEDGQGEVQRRAVGTTSDQVVPVSTRRELDPNYDENVASYERRSGFIIWFWDLEKDAARCFNTNRFDEIVNYVPTTARYNDEDRIGPIEVNKFVDDFDMP